MIKTITPSIKIYTKKSHIRNSGRGVFALREIKKNEVIEICPVIEIPTHEVEQIQNSVLVTYIFFFGKDKGKIFLALGFGSLYNHTTTPNALYKIQQKQKTITFIALRFIKKDEEITINYSRYVSGNNTPLWFEV